MIVWTQKCGLFVHFSLLSGGIHDSRYVVKDTRSLRGRVKQGYKTHIFPPNVTTTVTFSLDYTNQDIGSHGIDEIRVVLAPGFTYDAGSAGQFPSNMTTDKPTITTINGREELKWDTFPVKPVPFAVDETNSHKFKATITPVEAGGSYAEVFTTIANPCNYDPCTLPGDYSKAFSWQAGATIVPAYDVRAVVARSAGWGNVIPGGTGVSMESWNVGSP